jgi:hypothetical protein
MASDKKLALTGTILGGLAVVASGAHGIMQDQAVCTLTTRLVVVDLDNVKQGPPTCPAYPPLRGISEPPRILRGIPTKPGYDRDEYPPAMSDEGGTRADVRYVLSAENRSAGSVMRNQLAPYCDEQRFIFERWRNH